MPIVAIINRKGGCGKSMLATHIAAYWARRGVRVMLGDIDRQQSARAWLARRPTATALIHPWAMDRNSVLRVPSGVTHVVIDTPGGLHGFDLAKVVMYADFVVMPVSPSVFDLSSASQCFAEISGLPRVSNGKCRVAVVGMRLEPSERAQQTLKTWAAQRNIPFLGIIHRSEHYPAAVEAGETIFDQPPGTRNQESADWQTLMEWLDPHVCQQPMLHHAAAGKQAGPMRAPNAPSPATPGTEAVATPSAPVAVSRFPNLGNEADRRSKLFKPVQQASRGDANVNPAPPVRPAPYPVRAATRQQESRSQPLTLATMLARLRNF